jgi:type II secretory pathway component PulC
MSRSLLAAAAIASLTAPAAAERLDDGLYRCKVPAAGLKLRVSFKPDTSLVDLATWVTGFTCKNVVFDGAVAKHATKVTVISSAEMTPKQALALFVDAVEATGLVVKVKPDTLVISLGPNMPRTCPDLAGATSPVAPAQPLVESPVPTPPSEPYFTEAELDAGITKLGPDQVSLKRALLDRMLANPMAATKGARVSPATKNGVAVGFKLYAIRPRTVWARLGFSNGDTVRRINGMDVSSPD